MGQSTLMDHFSRLAGSFTRLFPNQGARILDGILYPLVGNRLMADIFQRHNRENVKGIGKLDKILVVSDIHIGDAILSQTAVSALRDFFPGAQIDFMVKKSVEKLLEGHPDVSQIWPAFTGGQFPNESDLQCVQEMSAEYDAVFNLCPFFPKEAFPEPEKVFHVLSHTPIFARNEWKTELPNHITYQVHRFIYDLLSPLYPIRRAKPFEGPQLFLSRQALKEAAEFFGKPRNGDPKGVVFLNPDTASPFTRIPFRYQAKILEGLVELPCRVLLGEGHTDMGIGERLLLTLPILKRSRVKLVPATLSLEAYAALIDHSDAFISGDTGPLHLAAALKKDRAKGLPLRNRTAVLSVFGATPPRISGYDSKTGFLESGQDAPCFTYQSQSSCRNITCMHKMAKSCDAQGCFKALDWKRILADVERHLGDSAA